jgi:hypothetical protein
MVQFVQTRLIRPIRVLSPLQLCHLSHPSHLSHFSNLLPSNWSALFLLPSDFCPSPRSALFPPVFSNLKSQILNLTSAPSLRPPTPDPRPLRSPPIFSTSLAILSIPPIFPIPPFTFHQNIVQTRCKHSTNIAQSGYKPHHFSSEFIQISPNFAVFPYPSYLIVIIVTQK